MRLFGEQLKHYIRRNLGCDICTNEEGPLMFAIPDHQNNLLASCKNPDCFNVKEKKLSGGLLLVTYSLLPSYTQTTWIACLTAVVCKLICVNVCW